jgi:dihydroflavonol-4-reductase
MPPWGFSPEMVFSPVHVDDVGEGIALAAARGRPGETYILAGDAMRLREVFDAWMTRPGGCRIRCYVPRWLARAIFAPLVPLQRRIGLPAFMSAETVAASGISYNFSSAKAERELGWTHRPGSAMWGDIIDREIALLASRQKRDLVSRLRPVERE